MKRIAIIPARRGSKGVPGKNKMPIDGKPLIEYSIEVAIDSNAFTDVIVSSNDDEILNIASRYNTISIHKRSESLSSDQSLIVDTILEIVDQKEADAVMLLQPTAPIRTVDNIREAISLLESNPEAGSVVSVVEMNDTHPARMYWKADHFLSPILNEYETARRQDIPPAYYRNGAIYLSSVKKIRATNSMMAKPMLPYVMPYNWLLNIDEPRDVLIAKALIPAWKRGKLK